MISIENDCCDCDLTCIGSRCPLTHVVHYYCDKCGNEDRLYHWNTEQLCINCIENLLEKVEL